MPVITSLLDTDLYKLSMQQIALNRFSNAHVLYAFKCRNRNVDLRPFKDEIHNELDLWARLRFTPDELAYLRKIRWLKEGYIGFLGGFQPDINHLRIRDRGGALEIEVEGNWAQTILWEVPLLAIVNEVYFRNMHPESFQLIETGRRRLDEKLRWLAEETAKQPDSRFQFTEFGTRRRYSSPWQREVVSVLKHALPVETFLGTSNVHLAKELELKPFGTMAHEYLQVCQVYAPLPTFQEYAFNEWAQEFRGDLGIALSDVVGMDAFLRSFDLFCCKLFDGARHDSGDPDVWCEKLIAHYEKHRIDPKSRTAVFSDGLTFQSAWELTRRFGRRIQVIHGIGTSLTNDLGPEPLNIVMKVVECNGRPVAKISDSPGKAMCRDGAYLAYLASVFGLENQFAAG